jgi:hypothetical protein
MTSNRAIRRPLSAAGKWSAWPLTVAFDGRPLLDGAVVLSENVEARL